MKEKFRGWYPRTAAELREIWSKAMFVPDANILLHMLRHGRTVRDRLLRVFEANKDRIWIPYQVGLEFHRNRSNVERQALEAYDKVSVAANRSVASLEQAVKEMRAHPYIDTESELANLKRYLGEVEARMEALKASHDPSLMSDGQERVSSLFLGRVGERPTAHVLAQCAKEAEERFVKKIPPGYKDIAKGSTTEEKYGDYVIWKEMIGLAKSARRPVIFITDDVKEDWWRVESGRKLGPRAELIEEFFALTSEEFHIYTLQEFFRHASDGSGLGDADMKLVQESIARDMEAKVTGETSAMADQQRVVTLGARIRALGSRRDGLRTSLLTGTGRSGERGRLKEELAAVQQELDFAEAELAGLLPAEELDVVSIS